MVTTNEPIDMMATTLVKTPRDCEAGAYNCNAMSHTLKSPDDRAYVNTQQNTEDQAEDKRPPEVPVPADVPGEFRCAAARAALLPQYFSLGAASWGV